MEKSFAVEIAQMKNWIALRGLHALNEQRQIPEGIAFFFRWISMQMEAIKT